MSYRFVDSLRAGSGCSVLILLASCMTYTIAVCTAKNCWWWTEELSETCRVLSQKQIWEIIVSSWFYYKNLSRCTVTWTSKKNSWFSASQVIQIKIHILGKSSCSNHNVQNVVQIHKVLWYSTTNFQHYILTYIHLYMYVCMYMYIIIVMYLLCMLPNRNNNNKM